MSSGLTVKPDDCPVTQCVRAGLYATDLTPSEDDVIGLVTAIKESLLPSHSTIAELQHQLTIVIGQLASIQHDSQIDLNEQMTRMEVVRARLSDLATSSDEPNRGDDHEDNELRARLGPLRFRFDTFTQWKNKASSWLKGARDYVCVDQKGRICQRSSQFMRADNEDAFPVGVYSIEPVEPTKGK